MYWCTDKYYGAAAAVDNDLEDNDPDAGI